MDARSSRPSRSPLLLVSGFGAFQGVPENPSEVLAARLAETPPQGWRVAPVSLPVSFARGPKALDEVLATSEPSFLLGLGVHRGETLRLELRARARLLRRNRPDVDGVPAVEATVGAGSLGSALRPALEAALVEHVRPRASWVVSEDAGGYVCERVYRHLLESAASRGVEAVFVHVPHLTYMTEGAQLDELRALCERVRPELPA